MNHKHTRSYIMGLAKDLRNYNKTYYNSEPIISDNQYDTLKDELRELDPGNALLTEVGAATSGAWKGRKHKIPMTSLNKVNTINELKSWSNNGVLQTFCLQEKLDGISVSLDYVDGQFIAGVTRGNGIIGEDITPNVLKMQGLVKTIPNFTGSIRGEIVLFKQDWKDHFPDMANPRNAASGLARRQSGNGQQFLNIICYDIADEKLGCVTECEKVAILKAAGFNAVFSKAVTLSQISSFYTDYEDGKRSALKYEIDGFVIKVNNLAEQASLGFHGTADSANPKGQIALKFSHEMRESVVEGIIWETGKSGRVTPVAQVAPVHISGVTIRNASLHNLSNIRKLNIKVGSSVLISRRNDVIPYIEEVTAYSGLYTDVPTECPTCDNKLISKGKYILCDNRLCPAQMMGGVEKWVSNLDIDGWGPKVIEALHKVGKLNTIADLYRLVEGDISQLDGHGERSAEVLLSNLRSKLNVPLHIALGSLNISGCGRRVFQTIVRAGYTTLDSLQALTPTQLERIDGIGPVLASDVYTGLKIYKNILHDMISLGLVLVLPESSVGSLSGKSFCCTGTMNLNRKDLINLIESNGGEWFSSVKVGLDFLIINDFASTTSKAKKARSLGTSLINETQFNNMVIG